MLEPNLLRLRFLGAPMGTLAYRPDGPFHALELEREFTTAGYELSPLNLPLDSFSRGPRVFRPGDSPFDGGLPGLIADSLPDSWGARMLKVEVPGLQTIMGKLAAIGERGPGGITFEPVLGKGADDESVSANLAGLAHDAAILAKIPAVLTPEHINTALARGGGSLGGAQPKVSAHLPTSGDFQQLRDVVVGGPTPSGQVPSVVKLSPLNDEGGGAVEFAFWKMAKDAGIRVPHACLVHDGKRRHFASARFDRYLRPDGTWGRRHVHTLSGFLHRRASDGQIDYEEFMRSARTLGGAEEARECFRRIVFNLLTTNRDDHGRNHAFIYDETNRVWTLSPAYDLNPNVANVLIALTWLGRSEIPTRFAQLAVMAESGGIPARAARTIYEEVEAATLGGWRAAAAYAGVPQEITGIWEKEMIQQTRPLREDARHPAAKPRKGPSN